MHRVLIVVGAGLLLASFTGVLLLSSVDPFWAGEHPTMLGVMAWLQQALMLLGAAVVGAGLVVMQLAPEPVRRGPAATRASSDWFE